MIAIIDYDAGNLKSVEKALEYLGEEVLITRDANEILSADKVILPGVGAFGDAMNKLNKFNLVDVIKEVPKRGIPFLGICLGLHLLYERSEESPGVLGLSILKGEVIKIPDKEGLKIPHMGWNKLNIKDNAFLFQEIGKEPYVYFVHSYYLKSYDEQDVCATTDYSVTIHASIEKQNIYACQFHPEKSGDIGLKILKNFANRR